MSVSSDLLTKVSWFTNTREPARARRHYFSTHPTGDIDFIGGTAALFEPNACSHELFRSAIVF